MTTSAAMRTTGGMLEVCRGAAHRIALLHGDAFPAMPRVHSPANFASVTVSVISPRQRQQSVAAGTANFATPTPWKWRTGENHQQLHYHGTLRCMLLPILKENNRPNKGLYERQHR